MDCCRREASSSDLSRRSSWDSSSPSLACSPGIAGRAFSTLGREGIGFNVIAQGSSEYNISCVVEASAMQRAVRALHAEFRLDEGARASS
jgi:hypothetical protein